MSIRSHPTLIKSYYKLIATNKIRFIIVGGLGFVVNYLMLTIMYHWLKLPILIAQIVGAEAAVISTFAGNNYWAFKGHHHISVWHKLVKFHLSAIVGILINSAFVVLLVKYAHIYYGAALIIGSAAGLAWNYTLYNRFVFKHNAHD
jgi:putative flippase GtrA